MKANNLIVSVIIIIGYAVVLALLIGAYHGNAGSYSKSSQIIYVYAGKQDINSAAFVCAHELGHHVYWKYLTNEQRKAYPCDKNTAITEYANTSCSEDFAENFAYAMTPFIFNSEQLEEKRQEFFIDVVEPVLFVSGEK